MAVLSRVIRAVLLLSCAISCPLALLCLYPDLLSMCIGTFLQVWGGFNAWMTPPVLFLLMNVVVCALAFTSGFVVQRPRGGVDDDEGEEERKNGRDEDGEEEEALYSEVFTSLFGEGNVSTRRKPSLKRSSSSSSSSSSTERKARPSYPGLGRSFSEKRTPDPNPNPNPYPNPRFGPSYPDKALRPAQTQAPNKKTVTSDLRKLPSAPVVVQARNDYVEDRDVDQRADAFIGNYYQKVKVKQVDPYVERLERSYGR